ncbi:MAG: hypothetical protein K8T89_14835 [Planctomycetes bacterium]|nr:hypothetical protein [Planctomycetota bacterium]
MGTHRMRACHLRRIIIGVLLLAMTPAVHGQFVPVVEPKERADHPARPSRVQQQTVPNAERKQLEPDGPVLLEPPPLLKRPAVAAPIVPQIDLAPNTVSAPILPQIDSAPNTVIVPIVPQIDSAPILEVIRDPAQPNMLKVSDERPSFLDRPLDPRADFQSSTDTFIRPSTVFDPPLGYTGPSSIVPRTGSNDDFAPVEDRWRQGSPYWDRYGLGFPFGDDYPYKLGRVQDPYNQNVLKGDYPIIGQHTFFKFTATLSSLFEGRQLPTATTPFESTARAYQTDFFGRPNQMFNSTNLFLSFDLFHGDTTSFKPIDWRVKLTPAFNFNLLHVEELGVVSPDVRKGLDRDRGWATLQEYFVEKKLVDLSPEYDFMSLRVGSQPFTSDFRGFIFSDINRAARLFGTRNGNRDQFNVAFFRQAEKDTNTGLNSFKDRNQNIFIFNYYRQDFIFPGYTVQASVHHNDDGPSFLFDRNKFLVRPDPAGVFQPHRVEATYLGFAGDGHVDRYNISHAFYWVLGRDSMNPLAGQEVDINGKMAALELSYDRDWARFRVSGFYASGDGNINDGHATGFDSILDNVNFAGSEFSFWGRQQIPLFGVNLTNRNSILSDLRSSKTQGQSNFVNPGLWVLNAGVDFDLTPKLRMVNNANFLWFDKTNVLEQFTFQGKIDREIGVDLSTGFEYRPLLNNNIIMLFGAATLIPTNGFKQLYNGFGSPGSKVDPLFAAFAEMVFTY